MRQLPYLFLLTSIILVFAGCNGSKAFVKRGMKMEEVGMMEQAGNYYYSAVMRDRSNPEALAAMQRAGQWVLNDHIRAFDDARLAGNREGAVASYEQAEAYFEKIEKINVRLLFPESAKYAYRNVKNAHLDDLYNQGMEALENELFVAAQSAFNEIIRIEPTYEDAAALASVSYCEPRYRQASSFMETGAWRSTYNQCREVLAKDPGYKDAAEMMDEALKNGQFTVAIVAFQNGSNRSGLETKFRSYVQQELAQTNDPFFQLVDRENQALILQEQQLALSGMLDAGTAVEVGGLLGAKTLLKGNVVDCEVVTSSLRKSEKQGYESYRVERVNENGKKVYDTKYRPVMYREYSRSRSVEITFQVIMISLETGRTELSEMVTKGSSDEVRYIRYDGNRNNLYPASATGTVKRTGKSQLKQLMNANQELAAESVMVNNAVAETARGIRVLIENELKRLIP
jgi:tetratricopeptide (TPR) repeat protein